MTMGGGLRRASFAGNADPIRPMLDVENDFWWPRPFEPVEPAVDALDLPDTGRILSVRTCFWNLVPIAAGESSGISSF